MNAIVPAADKVSLSALKDILHREGCSCVIASQGQLRLCNQRGVKDLYDIICAEPQLLRRALVADKVIGKGAAALMVLGGVAEVYADIISQPALEMFASGGIPVSYDRSVPNIINRAGTGICPVEQLCKDVATPEECLPLIGSFLGNK